MSLSTAFVEQEHRSTSHMELQFSFPDEIFIKIFSHCDLPTLHSVMQVCHQFKRCVDVQSVWKTKLAEQTGWSLSDPCFVPACQTLYKDCCRRYCEIFGNVTGISDVPVCTQCHCSACACSHSNGFYHVHDELIVFDFGSKTTWFKYTGDAGIGQLSVHPTVEPLSGLLALDDNDLCPVCTKASFQHSPMPAAGENALSLRKSSMKTFSKRSLCHLDCFSSVSSRNDDDNFVANSSVIDKRPPASQQCSVRLFEFLMRHIIKRNPCFQISNIPFVICSPTDVDEVTKNRLIEILICHLKVPEVCFVPKPIAVALYAALDTCLVIDSGANNTVISPLVNLEVMTGAVRCIPIGGAHLSRLLLQCLQSRGVDASITEAGADSCQVKRECYIAYSIASESKKKIPPKTVFIKAPRNGKARVIEVCLSSELYQAAEDMYVRLNLPSVIADVISSLDDPALQRRLLSTIVLTGGNSRLNGLSIRLVRDLQLILPAHLASCVHVVDPRLMTGRSDAVIGAAYVRKWCHAVWTTRRDYILSGVGEPALNLASSQTDATSSLSDDTASVAYNSVDTC